jgi:isoleucyl-tRNA synthetase
LGAKYGANVQAVAKLIAAADATQLVKTLRSQQSATLESFEIDLGDLVVTEVPKSGWMVASHDGESVALDLTLTDELIEAGVVREVIRFIQERRKSDGFDISDRITVTYNALPQTLAAIYAQASHIGDEVLATSITRDESIELGDNELGIALTLTKA